MIRNDSPYSFEQAEEILRDDGVKLIYRDFVVTAHRDAIREVRGSMADEPLVLRRDIALSVAAALKRNYKKLLRGNFPKKIADDFYADLILQHVLKEMLN